MAKDKNSIVPIIGACMRSPCWVCANCETENSNASLLCEICGREKPSPVENQSEDRFEDDTVAYTDPKAVPKIVKQPKNICPDTSDSPWEKVVDWCQEYPLVPTVAALLLLFLLVYLLK